MGHALPRSAATPRVVAEHAGVWNIPGGDNAGFRHIILGLSAPYPPDVARWVSDELITGWHQ